MKCVTKMIIFQRKRTQKSTSQNRDLNRFVASQQFRYLLRREKRTKINEEEGIISVTEIIEQNCAQTVTTPNDTIFLGLPQIFISSTSYAKFCMKKRQGKLSLEVLLEKQARIHSLYLILPTKITYRGISSNPLYSEEGKCFLICGIISEL